MFASLFDDLTPMQLAGVVGLVIVATIFLIRSRRNARRHQQQWNELRQGLRSTSKSKPSAKSHSKSHRSDNENDEVGYNWREDDSTVYIPEHSVELEGVAARIQEIERSASARIDTKIVLMQQLLIQTENAINKLQHALESAEQVGLLDHNPLPRRSVDEQFPASKTSSDSRMVRADTEQTGHVISGRVSLPPKLDEDPRFVRVYALADGGLSATKIATQTGMQIGEVELILSLRPRQKVHA
jgi:hypothetical protein